jgi:Single-stranded DNA-binding replication protein A (RPA), large (70 kD) subunit and related ssDNA-binding proteins
VRIQEVETRTIDGRNGETEILSGVVADETARLPFTDWNPHPAVAAGESCRIEDVYVREYRGSPSINLSEFSTVSSLAEPVAVTDDAPRLTLGEAVDSGGLFDVAVVASVIEVRDGSGLIERCPECGRAIQNDQCRVHGAVDGEDDLRIKAILDDGTATVTAIIGAELTEEIYGGDVADAKEAARDAMDKEVVADTIREELVGGSYRVRGSLSIDEYGANLTVEAFEPAADDPAERAAAVLREVRG